MNLIVAVDEKWGIGYKGDLLVRLREDLQNFAALTTGKTVILGSNTLATFPGGRVLKNRRNIVLNPSPAYAPEGAVVAHSIGELLETVKKTDSGEVFVIGGASVYKQLLPYCSMAYVTKVYADFCKDAYFTDLDSSDEWHLEYEGDRKCSRTGDKIGTLTDGTVPESVEFAFCLYKRINSGN